MVGRLLSIDLSPGGHFNAARKDAKKLQLPSCPYSRAQFWSAMSFNRLAQMVLSKSSA